MSSPFNCMVSLCVFLSVCSLPFRAGGTDRTGRVLPATRSEAELLLEGGELDSTFWNTIKHFYSAPLSVPSGDLVYLEDLVEFQYLELPSDSASLAPFVPWSAERIAAFFTDYPELAAFRPILTFEPDNEASVGSFDFRSGWFSPSESPGMTSRWRLSPNRVFHAEGALAFDEHTARWHRRKLRVDLGNNGDVQLGNFSYSADRGFVFGSFPSVDPDSQTLRDNWLYSKSSRWNGLMWNTRAGRLRAQLWGHAREIERAAGLAGSYRTRFGLIGEAGCGYVGTRGTPSDRDMGLYGFSSLSYRQNQWDLRLSSALSQQSPHRVPVQVALKAKNRTSRLHFRLTHLPRGYQAPFSRISDRFAYKLVEADSTENGYGTEMQLAMHYRLWEGGQLVPYVSYWSNSLSSYAVTGFSLRSESPVKFSAGYRYHPGASTRPEYHSAALGLHLFMGRRFGFFTELNGYIRPEKYRRLSVQQGLSWQPASSMLLRSSVRFLLNSDGDHILTPELMHELNLSERTTGSFSIQAPYSHSDRGWETDPELGISARFLL